MEISSATPSSSTRKLNSPKAISKPPVLAETIPVKLEMGSTVAVAGESMVSAEAKSAMLDDVVLTVVDPVKSTMVAGEVASMTVGTAMPMMVVDAVSTSTLTLMSTLVVGEVMSIGGAESTAVANDEPSILVVVEEIGDGWGRSR
jgi:hypothetical protein